MNSRSERTRVWRKVLAPVVLALLLVPGLCSGAGAGESRFTPRVGTAQEPQSISSNTFALSVCRLGTIRKITAGGKVVYTCRQKDWTPPEGDAPPQGRPGISAACAEGPDRSPVDCIWTCRPDGGANCSGFLDVCSGFGATSEGSTEGATCSQPSPPNVETP